MKKLKLFGFIFLILINLISINAILTDAKLYHSQDNSDIVGGVINDDSYFPYYNGTLRNGVTTGITGKLNESLYFDGKDDYINTSIVNVSSKYAISFWFKTPNLNQAQARIIDSQLANNNAVSVTFTTGGNGAGLKFLHDGTGQVRIPSTDLEVNTWYHVVAMYDGSSKRLFLNNTEKFGASTETFGAASTTLTIGGYSGGSQYFNGTIDEIAIYDRNLSVAEIGELYNSFNPVNPYMNSAPQIQTNLSNYYKTQNITINLNTTSNTNMSIIFNGGSKILICSNCNNITYNALLVYGQNNFTWVSNLPNSETNTTQTTIFDNVSPTINNTIPINYGSFFINLSQYLSCTDEIVGVEKCEIYFTTTNQTSNSSENNFEFEQLGLINYTINSTDLLGNEIIEAGVITISYDITFNFLDIYGVSLSSISSYVNGVLNLNNPYVIGISNFMINETNVTINVNVTDLNHYNQQFVGNVTIQRNISEYNISLNPNKLTLNFENETEGYVKDVLGAEQFFTNTSFIYIQQNLSLGKVFLRFNIVNDTHSQYYEYYNDYETHINENLALLNNKDTWAYFNIVDFSSNPLENVIVRAYHVKASTSFTPYTLIGQRLSNPEGYIFYIFDSDSDVLISFSKEGYETKTILLNIGDETSLTKDTAISVNLKEDSSGLSETGYNIFIPNEFRNEIAIKGLIYIPTIEVFKYTTNYRISNGLTPVTISKDSFDRVYLNLVNGTDYETGQDINLILLNNAINFKNVSIEAITITENKIIDQDDVDTIDKKYLDPMLLILLMVLVLLGRTYFNKYSEIGHKIFEIGGIILAVISGSYTWLGFIIIFRHLLRIIVKIVGA